MCLPTILQAQSTKLERRRAIRKYSGPEVLLKGMSSEKHFSLPERQKARFWIASVGRPLVQNRAPGFAAIYIQ